MNHKIFNGLIFICLLALTGCSVLNEDGYPKEFENSRDVFFEGRRVKEFKDFTENKMTARYFGYEKDGKTVKHGLYEGYDENGLKRADVIFCEGIPDGISIYYRGDKGTVKMKGIFRKGRPWEGMLSIATAKEKLLTTYSILSTHVKKEDPTNRIFVVHRLDRDTSGVMMFAKSEKVQEIMQKEWQEAVIRRSYIAVVEGVVENDKGTIRSFLKENKMLIMYSTKVPGEGDEAITHYKVLKINEEFSLLEVELETGRKNQIRVHMKELGHPVAGDKKYGSKHNPLRRTCLHANILAFKHPITGEELSFETPPPHRFLSLFQRRND